MATTIERAAPAAPVVTVPDSFNIADYLVDRHAREGRGGRTAILCGDESVTYTELADRSNRLANGLRALGVRREERVLLLRLDTPAFAYSCFGAQKIGAVPIPTNTLLKSQDYRYMLNDSRATIAVVSGALLPQLTAIARDELPYLKHLVVDGAAASADQIGLERLLSASPQLEVEQTSKDDAAFWLYSSGTTGFPKGAVHLHHDVVYCAQYYARGILGMTEDDRTFSVAKLFFAYGLGNALYFPFSVGATTILMPGQPVPAREIGNLLIKGESTCAYYWNKHERTQQTLLGEWIRTGDKYWVDDEGYFWYAGRSDDMLKVGGQWVSPVEIENTLVEHSAVLEAGVIGATDADGLTKPCAYVVLQAGQTPAPALAQELKDFVKSRIAPFKYPRWVEFVPELPKTATGKTQRFRLRQLGQTPQEEQ